jgi:hypothetical protein
VKPRVKCPWCGRELARRAGGGPIAHVCPHGQPCVVSADSTDAPDARPPVPCVRCHPAPPHAPAQSGFHRRNVRMTEPSTWPLFPLLPLVRPHDPELPRARTDEPFGDLGYLIATRGADCPPSPTVYRANVGDIDLNALLCSLPHTTYKSFGELVAAGWVID